MKIALNGEAITAIDARHTRHSTIRQVAEIRNASGDSPHSGAQQRLSPFDT